MSRPIRFRAVRSWLFDQAFPFWAEQGLDEIGTGFFEQLDLRGVGKDTGFKRVRTQARQSYVFSHAKLLGWTGPSDSASRSGLAFLRAHAALPGGGWAKELYKTGGVRNAVLDLYDNAFVLFALAWRRRSFEDGASTWSHQSLEASAHQTLDALEARLAIPNGFGFWTAETERTELQQNPHMHLLEASLAWLEIVDVERFRVLANQLVDLALDVFMERDSGRLIEFFDSNWQPAPGPRGRLVEPGHQYEWVWLLGKAGKLLDRDLEAQARALYEFARSFGHNPKTGLCWDAIDYDGGVIRATSRSWPQTEALKAELALGEHFGTFNRDRIAEAVDRLLDTHLAWAPYGTWMDQFDADGRPISDHIPASIFYHVCLAFSELLRLEDSLVDLA